MTQHPYERGIQLLLRARLSETHSPGEAEVIQSILRDAEVIQSILRDAASLNAEEGRAHDNGEPLDEIKPLDNGEPLKVVELPHRPLEPIAPPGPLIVKSAPDLPKKS